GGPAAARGAPGRDQGGEGIRRSGPRASGAALGRAGHGGPMEASAGDESRARRLDLSDERRPVGRGDRGLLAPLPNKSRYISAMTGSQFEVVAPFTPAGDQPKAIAELTAGLHRGDKYQTLLGVTGSGKTMTLAHVIANYGKPTLVLSHNKTLAAQLY